MVLLRIGHAWAWIEERFIRRHENVRIDITSKHLHTTIFYRLPTSGHNFVEVKKYIHNSNPSD